MTDRLLRVEECERCGALLIGHGTRCPECNDDRDWVRQTGLDDRGPEGQSTLDGGIRKPTGGRDE